MPDAPTPEQCDVAFSFVDWGRAVAHEVRERLVPAPRVLVYDRKRAAVGGQDGAEGYSRSLVHESSLTIIRCGVVGAIRAPQTSRRRRSATVRRGAAVGRRW